MSDQPQRDWVPTFGSMFRFAMKLILLAIAIVVLFGMAWAGAFSAFIWALGTGRLPT